MAIYHLSVSTRARGYGASHASYIEREGKYAGREDLEAHESGNMPAWAQSEPNRFWQAADEFERANGRAYTEIEISLPRELSPEKRAELVREFVRDTLGDRHAYTWAIHNPAASDGQAQPHVHLMFTERVNDGIARDPSQYFKRWNSANPELGGAGKDRAMSSKSFVSQVREQWANSANRFMEREGLEARIDHRSYRDIATAENTRVNELEPQLKRGVSVQMQARGVMSDLAADVQEQMARNGERLIADPRIGLDALTAHQSVFTRRDVERFVLGHTDGAEQYQAAMAGILNSPELLRLQEKGADGKTASHVERYTSQSVLDIETRLLSRVDRLSGQTAAWSVPDAAVESARSGRTFNADQDRAFAQLVGAGRIATVHGAAGTGKSYVLAGMREAYEASGFTVHGAILQGKTAEDLERDSGIRSQTIHSFLRAVKEGYLPLDAKSVVVVDEAGMVGSRQMEKLLQHVEATGARLRLVGDTKQLHAVDFGEAFGQVAQRTPVAGLAQIQRQREGWQREASEAFSRHDIAGGLAAYERHGQVHGADSELDAREALMAQWSADRQAHPDQTQIILAHTNTARESLNRMVRDVRKAAGELGEESTVKTEKGTLAVAVGERVMFGRNEYEALQVKNGTLGTVRGIQGSRLNVELDSGRQIEVDTQSYGHLDHGYALTVHKSQGMTVDRSYLFATPSMSAETTYVGMTRHRAAARLYYGRDAFAGRGEIGAVLSRAERKEFSGKYAVSALKPAAVQPPSLSDRVRARAAQFSQQLQAKREAAMANNDALSKPPQPGAGKPPVEKSAELSLRDRIAQRAKEIGQERAAQRQLDASKTQESALQTDRSATRDAKEKKERQAEQARSKPRSRDFGLGD